MKRAELVRVENLTGAYIYEIITTVTTAGANVKVSRRFRRVPLDLRFATYIDHPRDRNTGFDLNCSAPQGQARAPILYGTPYDLAAAALHETGTRPGRGRIIYTDARLGDGDGSEAQRGPLMAARQRRGHGGPSQCSHPPSTVPRGWRGSPHPPQSAGRPA